MGSVDWRGLEQGEGDCCFRSYYQPWHFSDFMRVQPIGPFCSQGPGAETQ